MTRLFLLPLLLILSNIGPASAQDECFLGSWELDSAYTFENAEFFSDGDNTAMSDMKLDFVMAVGSAFLTFGDDGDIVYTFDNWSPTFKGDLADQDSPMPGEMEVNISAHGDAWGRWAPGDTRHLTIWMGGPEDPEPTVETSAWVDLGGQRMDLGPMADVFDLITAENSSLFYSCEIEDETEYLYVNGESAGGALVDARYTRVGTRPPR